MVKTKIAINDQRSKEFLFSKISTVKKVIPSWTQCRQFSINVVRFSPLYFGRKFKNTQFVDHKKNQTTNSR